MRLRTRFLPECRRGTLRQPLPRSRLCARRTPPLSTTSITGPHRIEAVEALFDELEALVAKNDYRSEDAELWYDAIVSYGELVSTRIISDYLNHSGLPNKVDRPAAAHRPRSSATKDASVDLEASAPRLQAEVKNARENVFTGRMP